MITLLIAAAIWMYEYLDNLCHINRSTGTTYAFYKNEIFTEISKEFNIRWEFSKLHWKYRCKNIRIYCPPKSGSQYFNYKQ